MDAQVYDPTPLSLALKTIAGACNYARNHDGTGFSKFDADFGHKLADLPSTQWSPKMTAAAYKLARKYRGQLERFGQPFESIPEPPPLEVLEAARGVTAAKKVKRITYNGQMFVVEFPYHPQMVDAVKKIPGSRFTRNPAPAWTVPPTADAKSMLKGFADLYSFEVDDTAAALGRATSVTAVEELRVCDLHPTDVECVAITFPYEWELAAGARRFGTFQQSQQLWRVPIMRRETTEQFRAFLEQYHFRATAEAWSRIAHVLALREKTLEASRAVDAELVIPELRGTLRPFQRAGIKYALEKKRTFIADQMGLGKTIQGIGTLVAGKAFPAAVVTPASLKFNWEREFKKWAPHLTVEIVEGMSKRIFGNALFGTAPDVVIVNYDILGAHIEALHKLGIRAVVADEAHYIKNKSALRSKWLEELCRGLDWIILLTGTPILNRPAELEHPLKVMRRLEDMGGSRYFKTRYCRGAGASSFDKDGGASNLGELNESLRACCYIRRLKEQVLTELPPKVRTVVPLDIDNRAEYETTQQDFIDWVRARAAEEEKFLKQVDELAKQYRREQAAVGAEGDALEAAVATWKADQIREHQNEKEYRALRAEVLVRMESLKQCAVKGMLTAATAWVRDFLESGEKLVLFDTHKAPIRALATTFGAPTITGSDSLDARQAAVDRFMTDPACNLIVLNIQAGGVGITLTSASNVAFLEFGWTPAVHDQAEDRCHRIGQTDTVTAWYLMAMRTIYEQVAAKLDEKRVLVDAATEGGNVPRVSVFDDVLKAMTGVSLTGIEAFTPQEFDTLEEKYDYSR